MNPGSRAPEGLGAAFRFGDRTLNLVSSSTPPPPFRRPCLPCLPIAHSSSYLISCWNSFAPSLFSDLFFSFSGADELDVLVVSFGLPNRFPLPSSSPTFHHLSNVSQQHSEDAGSRRTRSTRRFRKFCSDFGDCAFGKSGNR